MKNIQLTQRETDIKALIIIGYLTFAGGIALLLTPTPDDVHQLPLINLVISLAIALFVWSTFELVEPLRYSRNWQIAGFIFVPLVWLLLVVASDAGIHSVIQADLEVTQGIIIA